MTYDCKFELDIKGYESGVWPYITVELNGKQLYDGLIGKDIAIRFREPLLLGTNKLSIALKPIALFSKSFFLLSSLHSRTAS